MNIDPLAALDAPGPGTARSAWTVSPRAQRLFVIFAARRVARFGAFACFFLFGTLGGGGVLFVDDADVFEPVEGAAQRAAGEAGEECRIGGWEAGALKCGGDDGAGEFGEFIKVGLVRWARLIKEAGIQPE